ncbi:MAG TPA: HEAT repeat domain-containing protein [Planctomycetes bacterium]|nr:HEAT repeat domain-containing protein [Planctomycetota bacterium]HIK59801.1 HEAT repeat domain-containing protein [Planctomycetota bacterium]
MICTLLLCFASQPLASISTPISAPGFLGRLVQDDEDEKPDKRPEVKEILGRLKDHATARLGKEDTEAVAVVDELLAEFPKSGLKDRASIAKGLSDCFKQKRPEKDGVFPNKLFIASAVAMGHMGPESAKLLQGWIGHKTHRKDLTLQRQLILALGKTKDVKSVKTLTDLITDKDPPIQGAAAEALGNFVHLKSKERKKIFEEILKTLTSARNSVDSDPLDTIARQAYDAIAAPMITTLQDLSGHDERKPSEWRRWWNKNKKKDWDKED